MGQSEADSYAIKIAQQSFDWYRSAAIRARRLYKFSEFGIILVSALVPLSAALQPGNGVIPAILGSIVVVIAGLRSVFHWHENYLRFSRAREAVESERRRFHVALGSYSDAATKGAQLVEAVTRIEQAEMGQWLKVAEPARREQEQVSSVEHPSS